MKEHVLKSPGKSVIYQIYKTLNHFAPNLTTQLGEITDNRQRKEYRIDEVAMAGINMFIFKQGSRNAFNNARKDPVFVQNYEKVFNMRLPHMDTPDELFRQLNAEELELLKAETIRGLIRKRVLEKYRYKGYYIVAIDGTGQGNYNESCRDCLRKTSKNGVTTYFRNVLEAKLVTPTGLSLSIASEWISNESKENFEKQDCEREAFKRLAKKLKKLYPRLPMVIVADGLYPWEGFFNICNANNWKYIVVLKDGNLKSLQEEINLEKIITPNQKRQIIRAEKLKRITYDYHYLTDLPYRKHSINYVELEETTKHIKTAELKVQRFVHITNFEVNAESCNIISYTGRLRQKIENEGFNTQKNQGYALEHKFSRVDFNAIKNYYQCLQIAHIINQLTEKSQEIKSLLRTYDVTIKYLWQRLMSFLLEIDVNTEEIENLTQKRFQIRLE